MVWIVGIGIFLFLLFMFPRQTGVTIGLLVALGAAIAGYFYLQDQFAQRKESQILISASFDASVCSDPKFPLSLRIHNGANTALDKLSIRVFANRNGFSDELYNDFYSSDKIMQSGENYSACWSLSDYKLKELGMPPAYLNWKAIVSTVQWHEN